MHLRPLDPPVTAEGGGAGRLPAVLAPGHDEAFRTRALASNNNVQFAAIMPLCMVSRCVHLVVEGVAEAAVLLHGHMDWVLDTAALPVTTGPHQQLLPCTQAG